MNNVTVYIPCGTPVGTHLRVTEFLIDIAQKYKEWEEWQLWLSFDDDDLMASCDNSSYIAQTVLGGVNDILISGRDCQ